MPQTIAVWWMWSGFIVFIAAMIAIDMITLHRHGAHRISAREAGTWTALWIGLALLFDLLLWLYLDSHHGRALANEKALEFLTGYLIEKALAVDNIFVFLMVFSYFAVPLEYQKRILLYGVLGAIVMRAVLILVGAVLIAQFHWIFYVFGAFLVFTGLKMLAFSEQAPDLSQNLVLRWMRGHLRITNSYHGERFVIRQDGRRWFTPLVLVLVLIELSDLIFAVDSIPAIFAVTTDPFIVFTSNIFAILGLRAMYFLLADIAARFHLLRYGLAMVLVFIGAKMLLVEVYKIPIGLALIVVALLIGASVVASLLLPARNRSSDSDT
ncbi:TerC family protein [Thermithiobacillus plumbiphilus]|uniref:TerC family protein n=1 Tax=Thermithiobacillus plumbiphilus TaxID=1729899 RepID=A0ABU9DBC3_9PROT